MTFGHRLPEWRGLVNSNPGRDLYLDAVDEALSQPRPVGQPKRAARARRRSYDVVARHLKLVERLQRQLDRTLREAKPGQCEACRARRDIPADQIPPLVAASSDITKQLATLTASMRDAKEAEEKSMASLDQDQIRKVVKAQILRLEITDDEWRAIFEEKFGPHVADVLMRSKK